MSRLRFKILVSILILFAFFLLVNRENTQAEQNKQELVCFRWAFGAIVGTDEDRRLVAVTRDTVLKTGDQLKMLVELKEHCFVYLFYHTGEGDLSMLFPYDLKKFDASYQVLKKYYIPQGNKWFELDEKTGLETFYLLASTKRLLVLEGLYVEYVGADTKRKTGIAEEILKKIRQIKKKHRKFAASAEKSIPIGGNVRGIKTGPGERPPDIDPIAAEVSSTHFYSRTFTIDHQ